MLGLSKQTTYHRARAETTEAKLPIIMVHGMALTGKTWETTPDGRMGWNEYFVRKNHPTYIVDQVARGRSGFNQAIFNNVRTKKHEANELPPARRFADEWVWPNFRIGLKENEPFEITLFPTEFLSELSNQGVPDLSGTLPDYGSNYKALSELALGLGKAVLISHSQSGTFPLEAALLNTEGIAGIVSLEPGRCTMDIDDQHVKNAGPYSYPVRFWGLPGNPNRNKSFMANGLRSVSGLHKEDK